MFDDIQDDSKSTSSKFQADDFGSVGLQNQENQNNLENKQESNDTLSASQEPAPSAPNGLDRIQQQPISTNQIIRKGKSESEPEDIFEEIDDDAKDAGGDYINQPPDVTLAANLGQGGEEEMPGLSGKKNSKIKVIIIILIVFLAAIGSAWVAYTYFIKSSAVDESNTEQTADENTLPESTNTNTQINQNTNTNVNTNTNTVIEPVQPVDSDGDGLDDADEIKFGTNPNMADTDADGLNDQEEVIKYKTNPNNADSDGDGYKDGDEVKNGYNPSGEGKLIDKVELP